MVHRSKRLRNKEDRRGTVTRISLGRGTRIDSKDGLVLDWGGNRRGQVVEQEKMRETT